ncbi:hypothetical protein RhiJN_29016 [Ceratobasidium sp. AG-Ba]|nr:hypothetical protein RhiJN_29016 [Ceratobasidium sp. AG-Ba]
MPPKSPFTPFEQKLLKRCALERGRRRTQEARQRIYERAWDEFKQVRRLSMQRWKSQHDAQATGDLNVLDQTAPDLPGPEDAGLNLDWEDLYKSFKCYMDNHGSKERKSRMRGLFQEDRVRVQEEYRAKDFSLPFETAGARRGVRRKRTAHAEEGAKAEKRRQGKRMVARTAARTTKITKLVASASRARTGSKLIMEVVIPVQSAVCG